MHDLQKTCLESHNSAIGLIILLMGSMQIGQVVSLVIKGIYDLTAKFPW